MKIQSRWPSVALGGLLAGTLILTATPNVQGGEGQESAHESHTKSPESQPASPGSPPPSPGSPPEGTGSPSAGATGAGNMHAHHRFTDTETYVKMFEDPKRAEWQKPAEVVAALKLRPGQAVADIGAGSGYFAFPIAKALGPKGKVYAVDIEQGMLDYMNERAKKENTHNVVTVLAAPDDARLQPESVDLVFICDTWHHIDERIAYLRRLAPALRQGGRIVIVDYQKRPLPVGPNVESKIAREEVVREFGEAGFSLLEEPDFLPYQYYLIFGAAPAAAPRSPK
jgi:SAM-dependent methyltransferase